MDVSNILDSLNAAQREAVTAPPGPIRVLAGAGSGKTRVLVQRIAWLIAVENASPWSIMAVTFTNKAAAEMRGRIQRLLDSPVDRLWIGTFHGIAHRLLRMHYQEAKLPRDFQILDSDDQQRMLKRIIKGLNLDEKKWPPNQAAIYISKRKDEGLRPQHIEDRGDPNERQNVRIYQAYQSQCEQNGVVDFAELLLRVHELLRDNEGMLEHYQERFRHILVDEFQDTNAIQYAWVQQLSLRHKDVFIVGDDDQSIYGWRGARIENILRFEKDFPGTQTIRLEQNYRSTSTILQAANALIAHNADRLGKNLWTADQEGEPIALYGAFNESDEARFVADRIRQWVRQGGKHREAAILYRSNVQSRVLEETLIGSRIPYQVYGGLRFYERAEIKDALAYLRLIANRNENTSFERVVNTPTRGLGERTLDIVRTLARQWNVSLWKAGRRCLEEQQLTKRAAGALRSFLDLIDGLAQATSEFTLAEQVEYVIEHSGLLAMYRNSKDSKAEDRVENLQELVGAAREFRALPDDDDGDEVMPILHAFLAHAALESGEGQGQAWEDCVQLMTMHMAKGLEFPVVFIVGLEEGLFPSFRSNAESGKLEEERRLAYVGITRACRQLYLSYAEKRQLYGKENYLRPSRFLGEIPPELVRDVRAHTVVSKPVLAGVYGAAIDDEEEDADLFRIGMQVQHPKFGIGVIKEREGEGNRARVRVEFDKESKWLVLAFAKLEALA
jgi:DNA helicase-2/ATP-dependent DNA helicase PcrA